MFLILKLHNKSAKNLYGQILRFAKIFFDNLNSISQLHLMNKLYNCINIPVVKVYFLQLMDEANSAYI